VKLIAACLVKIAGTAMILEVEQMVEPKLHKLRSILEGEGLDAAVIANPSNIQYFTGVSVGGSILVTLVDGGSQLLVPPLEYHRAMGLSRLRELEIRPYYKYDLRGFEAPGLIRKGIYEALETVVEELGAKCIGSDLSASPAAHAERIKARLGNRLEKDIAEGIARERSVKDPDEIEAVRNAARVTEKALSKAIGELKEGISELELAGLIEYYMRMNGAEEYAFPIIVAFSENAAYPHTTPSGRKLRRGDLVLVDLGARINGYCSDMTRTIIFGEPARRTRQIYEAVVEAVEEGINAIRPGKTGSEVDSHSRRMLEKYGLSKYFIHALGHGVGVDVHEAPRLSPGSKDMLKEGMIVTVEPGVYVPGLLGVRVEDMVLVKQEGSEVLTSLQRIWIV